ncbi:MAG: acyltransferase family protein [Acidimicrobiales bacterium]
MVGSGTTPHLGGLDGVRGLAVMAVVAYHLGFGWARGGYRGVDTFLVLSGYLITSGLLVEQERTGRIRLGAFWGRRARRLLPALLVVLVAAAAYAAFIALPDVGRAVRLDAVSALGFVANWRFVFSSQGYFGHNAAPSLLRHTWSLGVEAQLYVLWPLVVVGVCSRFSTRAVAGIALLLAAASAGLAVLLAPAHGDVSRSYYGTDTRAAAFLLGAAVAGGLMGRVRSGPEVGAGVGVGVGAEAEAAVGVGPAVGAGALAITAWLWATMGGASPWLFRGGLAVAAVTSAAVVAEVVRVPESRLARLLSVSPLRLLGRVSYGIYLWHWPLVLVLTHRRTGLTGAPLLGLRLGVTAGATALSWFVVERPVLGIGRLRMPRRWQPAVVAALGAPLIAALLLPASASAGAARARPVAAGHAVGTRLASPAPAVAPPVLQAIVLGDSVAVTVGNALKPFAADYRFGLANDATVGCGVAVGSALRTLGDVASVPGRCLTWEQDWQASVASARPDVVVILLGRWEVLDRLIDGRWAHVGDPAFDRYLAGQLDRALTIAAGSGATVVLCTAPYYAGQERPQGGTWPENDPARVDRFNALAREATAGHPGTVLYDLNAAVSPGERFASTLDNVAVRSADGVHFTPESGAFLSPRLYPALRAAASRAGAGERTVR